MENQNSECCPRFYPEKWDKKELNWAGKKFIKESMPTFLHIPFFPIIGAKITKMWNLAEKAQATSPNKDETLILFHDPSAFKSEIYLSVEKDVPEANNVTLSGNFVSRVFDGEYKDVPKFMKEMDGYLAETNKKSKDYYVHYAYCPKCAKKFGNNYMIFFAKID